MNPQHESRLPASRAGKTAAPSIGAGRPHESAVLHVAGEATYTDDIIELQGTLHAALGLSKHAHASIVSMDLSRVRAAPGVIAVFSAADIPGLNDCGRSTTTIPCSPTASSNSSASRCSPSSPKPMSSRAAQRSSRSTTT